MLVNHILTIQQHRLNNDKITLVKFQSMDYYKKRRTRVYTNKYYNHYTEDDHYPRRIKKPLLILIAFTIICIFLAFWKLFQ